MDPEELTRANIDPQLQECGWQVQNFREINIFASDGLAVREFLMDGAKEADHLLYADGRALGVVEAEPEVWRLRDVESQSHGYIQGLLKGMPAHRRPFPLTTRRARRGYAGHQRSGVRGQKPRDLHLPPSLRARVCGDASSHPLKSEGASHLLVEPRLDKIVSYLRRMSGAA